MTPFQARLTQLAGAALLVGCYVLNSTLLKGSGFELTLATISGLIVGWLNIEKPKALKRRDSLPLEERETTPDDQR